MPSHKKQTHHKKSKKSQNKQKNEGEDLKNHEPVQSVEVAGQQSLGDMKYWRSA